MYLCIYVNIVEISPPKVWFKIVRDSKHVENERAECLLEMPKCMHHMYVYIYICIFV